jgi:hypothetical protein
MEMVCSSGTSVDFQQTTWRYIPEDRNLHNHCCQHRSQNYFTTGSLLPISSFWRQAPWDTRPEFFLTKPLLSYSLHNILSDRRVGLSLMNMLGLLPSVHISHIACYWKLFLLHYIKVICQYRLCKADHACLAYFMLHGSLVTWKLYAWPSPILSLLYFLCLASPCSILWTCSFLWFCMTSACCLHNFLYNHIYTEGCKPCVNHGQVCTLENF